MRVNLCRVSKILSYLILFVWIWTGFLQLAMVFARTGQMDRAVDFVRRSLHCYEIAFIEVIGIFILNKKAPLWWARFFVCFICFVLCCVLFCFILYFLLVLFGLFYSILFYLILFVLLGFLRFILFICFFLFVLFYLFCFVLFFLFCLFFFIF